MEEKRQLTRQELLNKKQWLNARLPASNSLGQKNAKSECHAENTIWLLPVQNLLIIWTLKQIKQSALGQVYCKKMLLTLNRCFTSRPEMLKVLIELQVQMNSRLKSRERTYRFLKKKFSKERNWNNMKNCPKKTRKRLSKRKMLLSRQCWTGFISSPR